ncbi:MAG: hypothetical protein ACPGPC_14860 [Alphaproteobacteria bacterium]
MQSIIRTAALLLGVIALTSFGSASLPSVASAADITKSCGGVNQKKCSTSKYEPRRAHTDGVYNPVPTGP